MAKPRLRLFLLGIILPLGVLMMAQPTSAASTMSVSSKGNVAISVSPGNTGTGSDELTLTTNCSSGYVVYASATSSSASTSLSNGSGSEISASSNSLASPGSLSENTWGIANADNYADSKFAGLPTYANMAATSLTSGNSAVSATKIPVYYGVKVNPSITPGTYTGNVLYTAMVDSVCYTYTISYDANGGTGTMNDQELPMNTETALTPNTFSRDGYSFLGWSEDKDAKVTTFTDVQSVTGETFGLSENGANVTLYAIWEEDTVVEMQNWLGCGKLADNQIVTLLDTRNNVKYKVKKVVAVEGSTTPDYAECWMVENLRLTPGDSDPGTTTAYKNDEAFTLTADTSQGSGTVTFKEDLGRGNTTTYARYDGNANSIKYGAYYQWETAKLVCPAGWHLPSGGEGGEFYNLDRALGGTGSGRQNANNYSTFTGTNLESGQNMAFPLAGLYNRSSLDNTESEGYYWSSTQDNSDYGHVLNLRSRDSYVAPQNHTAKYYGFSVRCVANVTAEVDGYLQDFDEGTMLPNVGDKATLLDKRDGSDYTVERLVDGKVWMTQNLRLTDYTLTPDDSNVASNFKLEASNINYFADSASAAYTKRASTYYNNNTTYGAYYNFYAATAGTYYYRDGKSYSNVTDSSSSVDICPKGWRLPVGGNDKTTNEFSLLDKAINTTDSSAGTNRTSADSLKNLAQSKYSITKTAGYPDFALAGDVDSESLEDDDWYGFYWSSTVGGTDYGYLLLLDTLDSNGVYPQDYNGKYLGFSIRCIARPSSEVMQNFDASTMLLNKGDKATLTDVRDGSTYTVERLADGKVWMTQNLRIVNKTLTSADTNLAPGTTFTLPASNLSASGFTTSNVADADKTATYYNDDTTYGAYYNFYTATAGYSYYGDSSKSDGDTSPYDICPKSWRLPTGGPDGDFVALDKAVNTHDPKAGSNRHAFTSDGYSGTTMANVQASFNNMISATSTYPAFALAGHVSSGSLASASYSGYYRSSTVGDTTSGYYFGIQTSNWWVLPQNKSSHYAGNSVRCVAK